MVVLEDWSLMEPMGIYKLLAPKKIGGTFNGEHVEILMQDFKAFDPKKKLFRLEDGRIIKFGKPNCEYAAVFPGCYRGLMEEAKNELPVEDIPTPNTDRSFWNRFLGLRRFFYQR